MSTLWTPGGEVPLRREPDQGARSAGPTSPDLHGSYDQTGVTANEADVDLDLDGLEDLEDVDPETVAAMAEEMREVQRRLASMPAAVVVANHAMGCYELAAIHLRQEPPRLSEAALAIDAMGALVDGLRGRLGEAEATLVDALAQLRLVFVQLKASPPPA